MQSNVYVLWAAHTGYRLTGRHYFVYHFFICKVAAKSLLWNGKHFDYLDYSDIDLRLLSVEKYFNRYPAFTTYTSHLNWCQCFACTGTTAQCYRHFTLQKSRWSELAYFAILEPFLWKFCVNCADLLSVLDLCCVVAALTDWK